MTHTGAAALGLTFSPFLQQVAHATPQKKRILFFTKSSGFEHGVIKRKGDELSLAEKTLTELGARNNFEVTCSKDGSLFTTAYLQQYDAYFFYTTGDLTQPGTDKNPPMTPEGKAAFLDAIKNGKGFVGTHSATDTFHTPPDTPDRANRYINHGDKADPYVRMIGAEFIKHGKQQAAKMRVADRNFPGFRALSTDFTLLEEWYSLKDFSPDLHVLLVQETGGMTGPDYQRAPYPATWARKHGKGRVFYTSMGHRDDVWSNEMYQNILVGALSWAAGVARFEIKPNIAEVTPGFKEIPPRA